MTNIETDVTITEAVPQLSLSVDVQSGKAGQEVTVTATLVNDFDAPEGLPTAEQISLTAQNATLKEGSSVTQNGNAYSAVFVLGKEDAVFSANVLDSAVNYSPLAQPATVSVDVLKLADYSKLEAAVAKAKALNPEDYKDFSAVQSALNAIVYDLDETQQDKVDAMTAALENAIAGLEKIAEGVYKRQVLFGKGIGDRIAVHLNPFILLRPLLHPHHTVSLFSQIFVFPRFTGSASAVL